MRSYAQNFEDVRLWRALGNFPGGRYVDIGAQDPCHDSVSLLFYEQGWRGVHVEPTPFYAAALRQHRPDEVVVEAAVSNGRGPLAFYSIADTGLSTGDPAIADYHSQAGWVSEEIQVDTVTLSQIFDRCQGQEVHWLKIDVEGMEKDVLESWSDHPLRPWVLIIESTYPNTQRDTHREWVDLVTARGYREACFDGLSRFFVHESKKALAKAIEVPPNVFDGFQIQPRHFSSGELEAAHRSREEQIRAEAERNLQAACDELNSGWQEREERAEEAKRSLANQLALSEMAAQAAMSDLRQKFDSHIQSLQTEHQLEVSAIAERHSLIDESYQVRLAEQAAKGDELVALLTAQHSAERAAMVESHVARERASAKLLGETQRLAAQALSANLRHHRQEIAELVARYNDVVAHNVRELLTVNNQRLEDQQNHDEEMHAALRQHKQEIAELVSRFDDVVAQNGRELLSVNNQRFEDQQNHDEEMRAASTRHNQEIAELVARFTDVIAQHGRELLTVNNQRFEDQQNHDEEMRAAYIKMDRADREIAAMRAERDRLSNNLGQANASFDRAVIAFEGSVKNWQHRIDALMSVARENLNTRSARWASILIPSIKALKTLVESPLRLQLPVERDWSSFEDEQRPEPVSHHCKLWPVLTKGNSYHRADSLAALCQFDGRDFVRAAYVTVLGRRPDHPGELHYFAKLQAGINKLQILHDLRFSSEGSNHDPGIAGFDRDLKRFRRAQLPLIGPVFAWATGFQRETRQTAAFRALEFRLLEVISLSASSIEQSLASKLDSIGSRLTTLTGDRAASALEPASGSDDLHSGAAVAQVASDGPQDASGTTFASDLNSIVRDDSRQLGVDEVLRRILERM